MNAAVLGGLGPSNLWRLGGNFGNADTRLGTLDSEPLRIIAGNRRVLQAEPASRRSGLVYTYFGPNLLAGSDANVVSNGVLGATIAGGGETLMVFSLPVATYPNIVSDDFGTIGGGLSNSVGNANADFMDAQAGTVAGGSDNVVLVTGGTIGGGADNRVAGAGGTVGGGNNNAANSFNTVISGGARLPYPAEALERPTATSGLHRIRAAGTAPRADQADPATRASITNAAIDNDGHQAEDPEPRGQ